MENNQLQQHSTAHAAKRQEHTKERITIRIDRDVLEWFRSLSPNARGYQSRINQALREYMQNGVKSMEEVMRKVMREELRKIQEVEGAN
ncbi:MAG: BrnA antitoxin family protein [Legionellales bacterium]|nr:BrnA antitoxin family protein [Legionellales bacterium]